MSEIEDSGFTSGGRQEGSYPSVYSDSQQIGEFSRWPQHILEERFSDYLQHEQRTDISPRSRADVERIIAHMAFELEWRGGLHASE